MRVVANMQVAGAKSMPSRTSFAERFVPRPSEVVEQAPKSSSAPSLIVEVDQEQPMAEVAEPPRAEAVEDDQPAQAAPKSGMFDWDALDD